MKSRSEKNKQIQEKIKKEETNKIIKKITKILIIVLVISLIILGYGYFIESKIFLINEFKITNNRIPNSFHGVKLVHFSDLLYDSLNSKDLERLKKKINELEPDILVFTGNIKKNNISLNKEEINSLENFFRELNASILKFAVSGTNDDESFKVIMENSNFKVINNQKETIYNKDNYPIEIIGVDTNNFKIEGMNSVDYSVCLMHSPDMVDELLKELDCNLVLAGDNIDGTVRIPFYKEILNKNKYNNNYYEINETKLYISNGVGSNNNLRLLNSPSINLYRLTKY